MEPRVGQDDPDVRERRLGEHAGHVLVCERRLERVHVVELDHPRGLGGVDGRAHVAEARTGHAVLERHDRLVDRAVVAVVEDQDLRAPGDRSRQPDREAVRVGGGQAELPERQPEPPLHLGAHPRRVLGRQHEGDAPGRLLGDRIDRLLRRVSGHRPGVTQAEVDVLAAVDVGEPCPACLGNEDGVRAGPLAHPRHRDPRQEIGLGPLEQLTRPRMVLLEAVELAPHEVVQARPVDVVGHLIGPPDALARERARGGAP